MGLLSLGRSRRREIIDDATMSREEASAVFGNLATINRFLGGHAVTLEALDCLVPAGTTPIRILDVGAGGGRLAAALTAWGRARGRRVTIVSLDIDAAAVGFAREALQGMAGTAVVQADAMVMPFADDAFDVAICALFLHHFPAEAAERVLRSLWAVSRYGVVVNDLHRHPFAWIGIWLLTRLFGAHPIVQHDAPLSVLRGFSRADFREIAGRLGLQVDVRWRWAFRYLVTIPKRRGPLAQPMRAVSPREILAAEVRASGSG